MTKPMSSPDDPRRIEEAILVLRAQMGNERAFERLFERYEKRLLYYLRRVADSADSADDAFQETWIKVHRSLASLRQPRAFRAWLYRIARNAALDRTRVVDREVPLDDPGARRAVTEVGREEATVFDDVDIADLHAGLERIGAIHREVLTLAFLEDLSYDEIAEVVDVPRGTVRSRIHYGRRALRDAIETIRERRASHPSAKGDP